VESKAFLVTARKFRPQLFKDVVGQSHITKTLMNANFQNRIHHAYLFNGPRGVGKTTTARIFARAVNCLNLQDGEPCNECEICKNSLENRSMDIIEIDGASNNSVDDVRKLRENVKFPPVQGRYKMYIIDEVHMLSTSAFNALLKTLEEPPEHLLFVFATTEPHKVPATIMSRCQRFDFRRMEINDITHQLKLISDIENINIDEQSLYAIAKKADGSMRDSESIFDQVVAFTGKEITYHKLSDALHLIDEDFFFEITNAIVQSDLKSMFELSSKVVKRGYDYIETLQGLLEHCRNLLAVKITNDTSFLETSFNLRNQYIEHSKEFDLPDIIRIIQFISSSEQQIKYSPQQKVRFELTLAQLAYLPKSMNITELIEVVRSGSKIVNEEQIKVKDTSSTKTEMPESVKINTIASDQVNISKKISIDIASENSKEEITNNIKQKVNKKVVPKIVLNEKWEEFLDKYANSQYQLTSLAHINIEFEDNGILLILGSEVIYNNYTTPVAKDKLKELVEDFYDNQISITYKFDPSKPEREVYNINKNNDLIPANDTVEAIPQGQEIEEELINPKIENTKSEDLGQSEAEKAIIDLFNAKLSSK
jgi:DNA polymerase-3 subunit gamma/tau